MIFLDIEEHSQIQNKKVKLYESIRQDVPLILLMLVIRFINDHYNVSFIWPDENMQLLEPAYNSVFGQGVLPWEWNPEYPIRSPILVIPVTIYYWLLKITHLDYSYFVAWGVRSFFGVPFSVVFDYHLLLLLRMLFPKYKQSYILLFGVLLINNSNLFSIKFMTRTLYNTYECVLNCVTIYWWLKSEQLFLNKEYERSQRWEIKCRILTTINFMIRQSCILIWIFPYLIRYISRLIANRNSDVAVVHKYTSFVSLFKLNLIHLILSIVVPFAIDVMYYRTWNCTAYNFVKWNIIEGNCKNFGVTGFGYFFIETFSRTLRLQYALVIVGMLGVLATLFYNWKNQKQVENYGELPSVKKRYGDLPSDNELLIDDQQDSNVRGQNTNKMNVTSREHCRILFEIVVMFASYMLILSKSPHKEDRFILGIYPITAILMLYGIYTVIMKLRLYLLAITMFYPLFIENFVGIYHEVQVIDPGAIHRSEYIRNYHHYVQPIDSFLDLDFEYRNLYNSHLHIRYGKYRNINNMDYKTLGMMNYAANFTNSKEMEYYIKNLKPSHIILMIEDYEAHKDFLLEKQGYRVIKCLESIFEGKRDAVHDRYFMARNNDQ